MNQGEVRSLLATGWYRSLREYLRSATRDAVERREESQTDDRFAVPVILLNISGPSSCQPASWLIEPSDLGH